MRASHFKLDVNGLETKKSFEVSAAGSGAAFLIMSYTAAGYEWGRLLSASAMF